MNCLIKMSEIRMKVSHHSQRVAFQKTLIHPAMNWEGTVQCCHSLLNAMHRAERDGDRVQDESDFDIVMEVLIDIKSFSIVGQRLVVVMTFPLKDGHAVQKASDIFHLLEFNGEPVR